MAQKFKCIYCGDSFQLSPQDQEDYENGYIDSTPDTCIDCLGMLNAPPDFSYEQHSDADPGL